jgi:hypothetical protein
MAGREFDIKDGADDLDDASFGGGGHNHGKTSQVQE